MTSKLVVNTIEADTGISSVSFASSISLSSTSVFHLGDAGFNIGADTNINRPANGTIGFNINGGEKVRIHSDGKVTINSTASLGIPQGTTAQRPTPSGVEGHIRYNTEDKLVYYSDGTNWQPLSPTLPTLTSITGKIYVGGASNLTLAGTNFGTSNLEVRFIQSSDNINITVTVNPTSETAATVAVPISVYNNVTSGNAVSISVKNDSGGTSNAVNTTAVTPPSGGTITTSGNYRIHTFTSSGTFTVPSGLTLSNVEYLVVAGGGGGAGSQQGHQGGGGGAGGLRTSVVGATSGRGSSAESRITMATASYTCTVGSHGGGAGAGGGQGGDGGNSSIIGGSVSITSTGGGGGGSGRNNGGSRQGRNGGCGGGAGSSDQSFPTRASGTSGQGYDGGLPTQQGSGRGGAGGGAGAQGTDPPGGGVPSGNTAGGAGLANSITGSSVTYAKGGDCQGTGGSAPEGTHGLGEGGTGGYSHGSDSTGKRGGSGIIVIRYIL